MINCQGTFKAILNGFGGMYHWYEELETKQIHVFNDNHVYGIC